MKVFLQIPCGPPAPEPRAAHPNCASPQLQSCVPAIQNRRPRATHPNSASPFQSRVPPIRGPPAPSRVPRHPAPEHATHPTSKLRGPPAPKPRATHPTSKLRGPPAPRATHPNSAGPQLPSRVPPIQHPNSAGPQLRVPPIQTPRAPSSRAACHPSRQARSFFF